MAEESNKREIEVVCSRCGTRFRTKPRYFHLVLRKGFYLGFCPNCRTFRKLMVPSAQVRKSPDEEFLTSARPLAMVLVLLGIFLGASYILAPLGPSFVRAIYVLTGLIIIAASGYIYLAHSL